MAISNGHHHGWARGAFVLLAAAGEESCAADQNGEGSAGDGRLIANEKLLH